MKILKKICISLMIMILLYSTGQLFQSVTKAYKPFVEEVKLYSKGELVCFEYQEVGIGGPFVVYEKDGVEYPAYCLDVTQMSVAPGSTLDAFIYKNLEDNAIRKVILNGYPYRTPSELGCNSKHEAYMATTTAVYDVLYNYNWNEFRAYNEQGERVIRAAKMIADMAENLNEEIIKGKIEIQQVTEPWEKTEDGYAGKVYEMTSNVTSTTYSVVLKDSNVEGIKIVNKENQEKTEFQPGEKFKVLVPSYDALEDISFTLKIETKLKTKPILYGETPSSIFQDYGLAADIWEIFEKNFHDTYVVEKQNNQDDNLESDGEQNNSEEVEKENEEEQKKDEITEDNGKNDVILENESSEISKQDKDMTNETGSNLQMQKDVKKSKKLPRTGF